MKKIRFKFTNDWVDSNRISSQNITFLNITWNFNKHSSVIEITIFNFIFLICKY